ncbi:MAG: hypothetical protein I8H66_05000 [Sphingobacteriia bacterium]|nr:hypothetical protein [Sphingobacteriia bacterium]
MTRLEYLSDAIMEEPSLIDVGVLPSTHNGVANLLRKGLGIVAFNIIEDFIKKRAEEALLSVSNSGVSFANLTNALKESSTLGAIKSLLFNANLLKKDPAFDVINLVQTEAYNVYSTKVHPFSLSKYSLVYSESNVSSSAIPDLLKSFGIDNCWPTLKLISDSICGGIPDLASAFNNASQRRHSAAHNVDFNYSHVWLSNIKSEILAIAAAIDIALSAKCRQINRFPANQISSLDISIDLNYRFIELVSPTLFKERKNLGGKVIKNWPTLAAAIASHQPRLITKKEFLIILNSSSRIIDWHTA